MQKTKFVSIVLLLLILTACNNIPDEDLITDNKFVDCSPQIDKDYEMIVPIVPDTGVQRNEPIEVISRKKFIQRLKQSPLWTKLEEQFSENQDYTDSFIFIDSQGYVDIYGEDMLRTIKYGFRNPFIRNKEGHRLSAQNQFEMIETINLVIANHPKAVEIFEQLYDQYKLKVNTNKFLSDGKTLHAYIHYNDILFEMYGTHKTGHPIEQCNFNMITDLIID